MTTSKIRDLGERVDSLEPKPHNQVAFSAQRLAEEMKIILDYLTETQGSGCLTDQYGKDYSPDILALIRKAEASNCANGDDFVGQLNEDEQVALARLIRAVETRATTAEESKKTAPLRSTFSRTFGAHSGRVIMRMRNNQ